jgi:hypothetical protein
MGVFAKTWRDRMVGSDIKDRCGSLKSPAFLLPLVVNPSSTYNALAAMSSVSPAVSGSVAGTGSRKLLMQLAALHRSMMSADSSRRVAAVRSFLRALVRNVQKNVSMSGSTDHFS